MGTVHSILELEGRQDALLFHDRREVETAYQYMSDEDTGIGFLYSGWCQAALPHRKLPDEQGWQVTGERVTLLVEPGMRPSPTGTPVHVGVPYGSRARLIMLYLQSQALKSGSRDVELGKSLRAWLERLHIPIGGKSVLAVREQAERISRCKLTFEVRTTGATGLMNQTIVDSAIFLDMGEEEDRQGSLFAENARLSEGFFAQLQKHPVPLEELAVRAVANNSMALDLYAWLAYRLHALSTAKSISWRALKPQFGSGFSRLDNFKAKFLENMRLALAVYPAARVDVEETGLILHPSRPPVAPRDKAPLP